MFKNRIKKIRKPALQQMGAILFALAVLSFYLFLFANGDSKASGKSASKNAVHWEHGEMSDMPDTINLENDFLKMEFNTNSTHFTITSKETDERFYSNPPDEGGSNTSQILSIEYYDSATQRKSMDNYENSIQNGTFHIEERADIIRVDYLLGKKDITIGIPLIISAERMEGFLDSADEDQGKTLKRRYQLVDFDSDLEYADKQELLEMYPVLDTSSAYILPSSVQSSEYSLSSLREILCKAANTVCLHCGRFSMISGLPKRIWRQVTVRWACREAVKASSF